MRKIIMRSYWPIAAMLLLVLVNIAVQRWRPRSPRMSLEDCVKGIIFVMRSNKVNKDLIKQLITEIVNESTGIKATELVLKIVEKTIPFDVGCDLVAECIEELVRDHKILELEFTLPRMTYRIKAIYFPMGTSFNWK